MKIHLIKEDNASNDLNDIWANKKDWIFYLYKLNPKTGNKPEVLDYINIEKQYAIFNKLIKSEKEEIPEKNIDIALDAFNKKLKDWEFGGYEMRSILIQIKKEDLLKIKAVEKSSGFKNWIQKDKIIQIKNFINNIRTF